MITHEVPGDSFWDLIRKGAEAAAQHGQHVALPCHGHPVLHAVEPWAGLEAAAGPAIAPVLASALQSTLHAHGTIGESQAGQVIDLAPTALQILGEDIPSSMSGRALRGSDRDDDATYGGVRVDLA